MSERPLHVLFLCTHNSARSILAEALLNHLGKDRFKAFSAGSSPRENQQPNPLALQVLAHAGISTEGLHSKSWDEFAELDASAAPAGGSALHEVKSVGAVPIMDLVITVCDNAAGEVCPFWPAQPATAHWGYADPSETPGSEAQKLEAFQQTLLALHRRLTLLVSLPPEKHQRAVLQGTARELPRQA
ncbi:MAG: arsenate reductase ArsC [Polaromonas sp.]|nr:arsenate reductase ArsC [Polaromonas sp.]